MKKENYTLEQNDIGKTLEVENGDKESELKVSVPSNSNVPISIGSEIKISRYSEKEVVIVPEESVVIESPASRGPIFFIPKFSEAVLRKKSLNSWNLSFDVKNVSPIFAEGGDEVFTIEQNDKIYRVHIFSSLVRHAFTVISGAGGVEYLVVAGGGGGGGGQYNGGGGGAGGYRSSVPGELSGALSKPEKPLFVKPGIYEVVVGAGGIRGWEFPPANKGENSSFGPIVSFGGGPGAKHNVPNNGFSGGSGGGGSQGPSKHGQGTEGQGFRGSAGEYAAGGGGGGAGESGFTGSSSIPYSGGSAFVNGGDGLPSFITGELVYRAGGGGGGGRQVYNIPQGIGGLGGGGNGGPANGGNGFAGTPNTGGGGGGCGSPADNSTLRQGGNGGSGIVIVRYRVG